METMFRAPSLLALLLLAAVCTVPARANYVRIPAGLEDQSPGNHGDAGADPMTFRCELDPKLTEKDLPFFIPDIQGNWGNACGRNRGVFVLDPPDGHTYGCGNLPKAWGVETVGDLTNMTKTQPKTAIKAYANLLEAMYNTTIGKTAAACDNDALTMLTCGREEPWRTAPWYDQIKAPIRAVNIGGLFVLERWILPTFTAWGDESGIHDQHSFSEKCEKLGTCGDLKDHWKNWYKPEDFKEMKKNGLNSIRLPVGWWYFAAKLSLPCDPYIVPDEDLYDRNHPITNVIGWAMDAGLYVILDLHGAPGSQNGLDNSGLTSPEPNEMVWGESWMYSPEHYSDTIRTLAAMAEYVNHIVDSFGLDNVMALELLNEPWAHLDLGRVRDFYVTGIEAVRLVRPQMPIIIHDSFRGPMWATLLKDFPFENVVMDTHIYHGFNPADLSSDTAETDRQKMYVHERMACSYTSMLRYQTCACIPVFVGEWSLAIDNCMPWLDSKFADYGQCNNLAEREMKSWWTEHTRSFAMRQINMFEREMGWAFWTWKLEDQLEKNQSASKYWSFSLAVKHGFIDTTFPNDACVHPPAVDWMTSGTADDSSTSGDAGSSEGDSSSSSNDDVESSSSDDDGADQQSVDLAATGGGGDAATKRAGEEAVAAANLANTPPTVSGGNSSVPSTGMMAFLVLLGTMVGAVATVVAGRIKNRLNGADAEASAAAGPGWGQSWMPSVFSSAYDSIGGQQQSTVL